MFFSRNLRRSNGGRVPSVKIVLIDFHTHTAASDGALSPRDLVALACERKVDMLAITDHDTVAGYPGGGAAGDGQQGVLQQHHPGPAIPGIELPVAGPPPPFISRPGHGLRPPAMREGHGYAQRGAGGARFEDRPAARGAGFCRRAGRRPGARPGQPVGAPPLFRLDGVPGPCERSTTRRLTITWGRANRRRQGVLAGTGPPWWQRIVAAGGVAVIAHPLKYKFTRMKLRRMVIDFVAAGGAGIEILSGRQTRPDRPTAAPGRRSSLEVSGGLRFPPGRALQSPAGRGCCRARGPARCLGALLVAGDDAQESAVVSQFYQIHPDNPQAQADSARGGHRSPAAAWWCIPPTRPTPWAAISATRTLWTGSARIRKLDDRHNFTLVQRPVEICRLRQGGQCGLPPAAPLHPGPYTFILKATSEVPRRLMHPKRKTVGRVPDNRIAAALLTDSGRALMSVTLIMPGDEYPLIDPTISATACGTRSRSGDRRRLLRDGADHGGGSGG